METKMDKDSGNQNSDLQEVLKPFYQRASEAEERLSRLEISLASKKDVGDQELQETVSELQSQLENARSAQISEQVEAEKKLQALAAENAKLKYQILHLVRAVKGPDEKLPKKADDKLVDESS